MQDIFLTAGDPYLAQKYLQFKRIKSQSRGPSFLERMEKDIQIKNALNAVGATDLPPQPDV